MVVVDPDGDWRRMMRDTFKNDQREQAWAALGLDRAELDSLRDYVDVRVSEQGCNHELRFASEWAADNGYEWPRLRNALGEAGGYCDCEILFNVDPDENV